MGQSTDLWSVMYMVVLVSDTSLLRIPSLFVKIKQASRTKKVSF